MNRAVPSPPMEPSPHEAMWRDQPTDPLATCWPDFVDCSRRLDSEAPFLDRAVGPTPCRILDAALGIGCESVYLAQQHHTVTGNEVNPAFRAIAKARIEAARVPVRITAFDWRQLPTAFAEGAFDVVLLLGNSFCLAASRYEAIAIGKFLDSTVGAGVRGVCAAFDLSSKQGEVIANHVVIGVQSLLSGLKGRQFKSSDVARAFIVGELQQGITSLIEAHARGHYDNHATTLGLAVREQEQRWIEFQGAAAREVISLANGYFVSRSGGRGPAPPPR